jgi:hypothetical protein
VGFRESTYLRRTVAEVKPQPRRRSAGRRTCLVPGRAASPEIGRMTIRQALRPNFHCHLLNTGEKQVSSFMRFDLSRHMMHGPTRAPSAGVERSCCLIHASIAGTKWQNADSARRCRFRKSQQKRASDFRFKIRLDSQVAGLHPVCKLQTPFRLPISVPQGSRRRLEVPLVPLVAFSYRLSAHS